MPDDKGEKEQGTLWQTTRLRASRRIMAESWQSVQAIRRGPRSKRFRKSTAGGHPSIPRWEESVRISWFEELHPIDISPQIETRRPRTTWIRCQAVVDPPYGFVPRTAGNLRDSGGPLWRPAPACSALGPKGPDRSGDDQQTFLSCSCWFHDTSFGHREVGTQSRVDHRSYRHEHSPRYEHP